MKRPSINRTSTKPISVPRTRRNHLVAGLSSAKPGVCHPVAFFPVLREDAASGMIRISTEMLETKEILMNRTNMRITAYVVPKLALERFNGSREELDKSFTGEAGLGGQIIPWFETHDYGAFGSNAVYKAVGLHAKPTDKVNTDYLESYNLVWNFRAKNRSPDITQRGRLDSTLAPGFWQHSRFAHIVPDFDQAVIDGEVALNYVGAGLQVKGAGGGNKASVVTNNAHVNIKDHAAGTDRWMKFNASNVIGYNDGNVADNRPIMWGSSTGMDVDLSAVYAEFAENGITVSLSNIELAKKTQAFAKLRERYEGHEDDIIDMLMSGLSIPEQHLKQPILLADVTVPFQQAKRYATDSGNLADSATSGAASVDIRIRMPPLSTGGVIVVLAEFYPDQIFERQQEPYFHAKQVKELPDYLRDELDPEKVDVVLNGMIDTSHTNPTGTFGFGPMNWRWTNFGPTVGGKFMRPTVNTAVDEDRMRLWAVEDVDPALSSSFYLIDEIHQKVFLDTETDPFEIASAGNMVFTGLTRFGGLLIEATNNYDKVMEKAPVERIVKPVTP